MKLKSWIKDPYATLQKISLPNGMTVWAIVQDCNWTNCRFMMRAGSYFDADKEGLAHFSEHLFAEQKSQFLWRLREHLTNSGAPSIPATTSYTHQWFGFEMENKFVFNQDNYKINSPRDLLQYYIDSLFFTPYTTGRDKHLDIITREFNQSFRKGELEYYRRREIATLGGYENVPYIRFVSPLGTPTSIANITIDDLNNFKEKYFNPQNCDILLICNKRILSNYLKILENVPVFGTSSFLKEVKPPKFTGDWVHISAGHDLQPESTVLNLCYYEPSLQNYATATILSSYFYEVLFKRLRDEEKLVYSFSKINSVGLEFQAFGISCPSHPNDAEKISKIIDMYFSEGITEDAFEKHQVKVINAQACIFDIPSTRGIMKDMIDDIRNFGRVIPTSNWIDHLSLVTYNQALNYLGYFNKNSKKLIVNP